MESFLDHIYFTTLHLLFVILAFQQTEYQKVIREQKLEIYKLKNGIEQ